MFKAPRVWICRLRIASFPRAPDEARLGDDLALTRVFPDTAAGRPRTFPSVTAGCPVPGAAGEDRPLTRPVLEPPEDQGSAVPSSVLGGLRCLPPPRAHQEHHEGHSRSAPRTRGRFRRRPRARGHASLRTAVQRGRWCVSISCYRFMSVMKVTRYTGLCFVRIPFLPGGGFERCRNQTPGRASLRRALRLPARPPRGARPAHGRRAAWTPLPYSVDELCL